MTPSPPTLDAAFAALRARLDVRTAFPPDVLAEAERVARERDPSASAHADRTAVPFVTVDPPGSRDLDQALHLERKGDGYTVRYAIADVGFWVDRGSSIEAEAWKRGVTFYAPDERERLYPPSLSEGAASLLPEQDAPAVLFTLELDERAEIRAGSVERARVRSRAQLTYAQVLVAVKRDAPPDPDWLPLLREIGELRIEREAERGGVSLPIVDQHVQRRAAAELGYALAYDVPNRAEEWNAQISLLTGHYAAVEMLRAGVGLLRTMPPFDTESVKRFRAIARGLGFEWPKGQRYADFIRGIDLEDPNVPVLVWQAQRTMRGAEYVAFDGERPEHPLHAALAFPYAHATAPLRRLADRYVLDLLVELERGRRPGSGETETLRDLPPVMREAQSTERRLEREVVNLAEAWTLRDRVGETFPATVIGEWRGETEVQIAEPPLRATVSGSGAHDLGDGVAVRVAGVDMQRGRVRLRFAKMDAES